MTNHLRVPDHTTTTSTEPGDTWVASCSCPWMSRGHTSRRAARFAAQTHRKQAAVAMETGEDVVVDNHRPSSNRILCEGCGDRFTWEHGGWTKNGLVSRWMCWNCQSLRVARSAVRESNGGQK